MSAAAPKTGNILPNQPSEEQADTDSQLVAGLRAGDPSAYEDMLRLYGERLYNSLLHLAAGDPEQAAEFTQEAFVRAYQRLDQFDGRSRFYTWLYRLARNRAIDLLAKKKPTTIDSEGIKKLDKGRADTAHLEHTELQTVVQQALYELPTEQRNLLLMRDYDGLDYQEIAEHLDVPIGTVKSRINRARKALRQLLEPRLKGVWP